MARKLEVEIVGDSRSFSRAIGKATSSSSRFSGVLGKLGKAALGVGAVLGGGLAVAAKVAFDEIAQAQKVTAQTNAVLKSTGKVANVTAKEVDALATALMLKSGVDDEVIQSGENMLLTFKNIRNEAGKGNKIFTEATKATLDLSVAMGKDMKDSAILVGKALNDPIRGLGALRRVGVQFTKGQEDQIKAMVEAGDVMGAQKIILEELNSQFGKSAEAVGKTLPGQFNILKEATKNLLAEGFEPLVPVLTRFVQWITANLPTIRRVAKGVFGGVAAVAQNVLVPAFGLARTAAERVVAWFRANWPTIRRVAGDVLSGVRNFIVNTLIPAFQRMREFIGDTVRRVVKVIQDNRGRLLSIWENLRDVVGDVVDIVRDLAPIFRNVLVPALKVAIPILQIATSVMATLSGWAASAASQVSNLIGQLSRIKGPSLLEILGRQHGGPVAAGRPYMVGEAGPELFVPSTSGRIVPNGHMGLRGGGGGGVSQTVVVPVYLDGRQIAEAVFDPLRNVARRYTRTNGQAAF